jgi:tRNA A37 threonylcarbamoyladenosine biosynthesis protein TsaE
VLIEWPERMEGLLPADRLELALRSGDALDERLAEITGYGEWAERLAEIAL